jgi:hypothetical protein
MDGGSPGSAEPGNNDEATTRVVLAQLAPRYAPVLGEEFVVSTVRAALAELRAQARIEQFVVLLAQRRAEDQLRHALQEQSAPGP